ncbi:MAG: hypothetical protein ABIG63_10680 [Chloroflexota bacterium]
MKPAPVRNYFVDEAGDGTLFSRRGRVIIGKPGCSRFFILGLLDIPNPERLSQDLENLRAKLLADPYFDGVPSMQLEVKKTAHLFMLRTTFPKFAGRFLRSYEASTICAVLLLLLINAGCCNTFSSEINDPHLIGTIPMSCTIT